MSAKVKCNVAKLFSDSFDRRGGDRNFDRDRRGGRDWDNNGGRDRDNFGGGRDRNFDDREVMMVFF